jgi:hypothetical protein
MPILSRPILGHLGVVCLWFMVPENALSQTNQADEGKPMVSTEVWNYGSGAV